MCKAQGCGNPRWTCWSQQDAAEYDKSAQGDWNLKLFISHSW